VSYDHPSPWSPSANQHQQQGWPPAPQPGYAPEPPQPLVAPVAAPPLEVRLTGQPAQGRGLAIAGVVLGGLGLVAGGTALVVALVLGLMGGPGGGAYYGLRGTVSPVGGALTGTVLAAEVSRTVSDDGGEPDDVTCPATVKVAQDVTAVCHGTDYGDDAAFVVFFEDDRGAFTLLEV
jgi:hypothetical protein